MITINIDGKEIQTQEGKTVLQAAADAGIYIPNLCYHPDLPAIGSCRLCVVEIKGMRGLPTSCTTKVTEGMVVNTKTETLQKHRSNIVWLLLSEQPGELEENSQFKKVVEYIGKKELLSDFCPQAKNLPVNDDDPFFIRDMNKCILCGRCVLMCQQIRGVGAIGMINRGVGTIVSTCGDSTIKDAGCAFCGACVEVCPSGALTDRDICKDKTKTKEERLLPCKNTCPAGIDIPRYVKYIAAGRYQDAVEVIRQTAPFPHTLGCVCDHPCEQACRRNELNNPVAIKALKRFVAEKDDRRWKKLVKIEPDTGKKVAIIGSGPAGLTAGWFLRKKGHSVTVFESLPKAGGTLRIGIPKYRLPKEVLDREIKDISDIGVEIKTNTKVDSIDKLFKQGFDAVFIAVGATKGMTMGLEGEDDPRVMDGMSILKPVNLDEKVDLRGKVGVVGGGNVAIDAARCALRSGADEVVMIYRRTREEMPAAAEEVEEALEEGIKIEFLVNPQKITPADKLQVECIRMELGKPDSSGRRSPVPIEGSEFILELDRLIIAIGQSSTVPAEFGVEQNKRGFIKCDEKTTETTKKGVFAAGDISSGPASVIKAIAGGRKAASSIDKYLGGDGLIDQKYIADEKNPTWIGRDEKFAHKDREKMNSRPGKKRKKDFDQVELGFDEKTALKEASRCMRCQLRFDISRATMPPEKNKD
ncbi:MAG TPA: FAD-dependent oxidoreductase [Sedimentisphaerales bacterium]|nr:FAD-dependent oxidoreductase [Sedimentisphaerales bacterium]